MANPTSVPSPFSMTPNVSFTHQSLARVLPQYQVISDVLQGELTVKARGTQYLPYPDSSIKSPANERYISYKTRAVFYNASRRTLDGLIGQIYMREPLIKMPDAMKPIEIDATGSGVNLIQQSKKSVQLTLAYSRSGLFVDYPQTPDGGASVAEVQAGLIRPTINSYAPTEIINWRVRPRGAKDVLSLVVLAESYTYQDDGFEKKDALQFRVLRLRDDTRNVTGIVSGTYYQEIWSEDNPTSWDGFREVKLQTATKKYSLKQVIEPRDAKGALLDEIPFSFIGRENNDADVDEPTFYDLASINLAHYRNSADYEEVCFVVGQPTIVVTGLTNDWYESVLKKKITFGSRGGIPLPANADAKLLQATENTMIKEAMESKEAQMVALGAKLVEPNQVEKTAFEAKIDATQSSSTLSQVADNVSSAYVWALEWCNVFMTATATRDGNTEEIQFELNKDFDVSSMTPEERTELLAEWQAGAITWDEMRAGMRRAGIATEDDELAKQAIADDQADQLKQDAAFNPLMGAPAVPGAKAFISGQKSSGDDSNK